MDDSSAASGIDTALTYLTSIPAWYLATSVDNQPHVRPFSFAAKQDGKLWFCTATTKDVWQELLQNPLLEATAWWPGHGWLILRGRAGMAEADYPQADTLRRLHAAAMAVRGADVAAQGATGPAFGEALRKARIAAITAARS